MPLHAQLKGTWQAAHTRQLKRKAPGTKKLKISKQTAKNTQAISQIQRAATPYRPFYKQVAEIVNSNEPHVHLLTQPSNWTKCFSTYEQTEIPRQYFMRSLEFTWLAQAEAATVGNLYVQIMLVSLKARQAAKVIERTTRLSNMEHNIDYIYMDAGSSAAAGQGQLAFKLNPILYTVHYNSGQRRIGQSTMAANEVSNIRDSTTMGKARVKWNRDFKNDEHTENGFLDIDSTKIEPKNQLYCVVFSNSDETLGTGNLFFSYRVDIHGNCNMPD